MIARGFNAIGSTKKLYMAHMMIAFTDFAKPDANTYAQSLADSGYNCMWAFVDSYIDGYIDWVAEFMDACYANGIQVIPGAQNGSSVEETVRLYQDTWDHPALCRIKGKRVYANYGHYKAVYANVITGLAAVGINKSNYLLLASGLYPLYQTWTEPPSWAENNGAPTRDLQAVAHVYEDDQNRDGIINFAADKGTSDDAAYLTAILEENSRISQVSKSLNKIAVAGITPFYASTQFTDTGFQGAASIWQQVIDMPVSDRPLGMCDTTADDYVELSYMSNALTPVTNGLFKVPQPNSGFNLGANVRYPLTDHSGLQKFCSPYIAAYVNNKSAITITEERLFAWYWLHPLNADLVPNIPSDLASDNNIDQNWWNNSVYATGSIQASGVNQVAGIKGFKAAKIGKIRMAAHITAPAVLRITIAGTNYDSPVRSAGVVVWECAQVLGMPVFSIVRGGVVVKTGTGPQEITNSAYPGGWNTLISEI